MKAAVLEAVGTRFAVHDVDLAPPRSGEVLVRIAASGVCGSDLNASDGKRKLVPFPAILGHEAAGVVVEVGPEVTTIRPGDHVVTTITPSCGACPNCLRGRPNYCTVAGDAMSAGMLFDGTGRFSRTAGPVHHFLTVSSFAEYAVIPESGLVAIRPDMPLDRAALISCAVLTGFGAVANTAGVPAGARVAVFGTGGVGLNIVQGARIAGASRIVAVDVSDQKLEVARRVGATDTINSRAEDAVAEIRRLCDGADYAFDASGREEVIQQAWRSLDIGGELVIVGLLRHGATLTLDADPFVNEQRIRGCYYGSASPTRDIPALVERYLAGDILLDEIISHRIPLEGLNEACDRMREAVRAVVTSSSLVEIGVARTFPQVRGENFIDGQWMAPVHGASMEVIDPATGTPIATVALSSAEDVDLAVAAAVRARDTWAQTTPGERAEMLLALAEAIKADAGVLTELESRNVGKPIAHTGGEIRSTVDRIRFFAGAARCLEGRAAGEYLRGYTSMTRREPVGVVALITPWNYPLLMAATKLGPSLAGGNTVILKPSRQTPLTTLRLAELARDIFPAGVLNVITGDGGGVWVRLVQHPDVEMVSLTGDTATGREVARAASDSLKRVHLELGGKAPAVVLDDADPAQVAASLREGSFWNAGQDCSAAARVIVTRDAYDQVLDRLGSAVSSLRVGDPADPSVEMGPLAHAAHRDRVVGMLDRAREENATVVTGGGSLPGPGFFVAPTIVTDVDQQAEIVQREVFGPVVTVQRAPDDAAAIKLANDVAYGLGASIFTRDVGRAMDAARRLRFGTVWINDHGPVTPEMPWGGFKESGYGKERSIYSLEDYTEIKHVMVKLPS